MCIDDGIVSHSDHSPCFAGGTRRIATVTISLSEMRMQSAAVSRSGYLPVPTIKRDDNVTGPSFSDAVMTASTSTDERDDLEDVAVAQRGLCALRLRHDHAVLFDGDALARKP